MHNIKTFTLEYSADDPRPHAARFEHDDGTVTTLIRPFERALPPKPVPPPLRDLREGQILKPTVPPNKLIREGQIPNEPQLLPNKEVRTAVNYNLLSGLFLFMLGIIVGMTFMIALQKYVG